MQISEKLTEEVIDSTLLCIKKQLVKVKDNYKWKKLFIDTGEFFANDYEHSDEFYSDLLCIFSKENMKRMACDLKDKSGFEFRKTLHQALYKLMMSYEFDLDMVEMYSHHFMQVIITYLEDNMPEKYTQMFLADWKSEEFNNFKIIQERLKNMEAAIQVLGEKKKHIFSIAEIDMKLRNETISPKIGIDFFDIDDEEFLSEFHKKIDLERLFVIGKSREETIYCLLNEIQKMNLSRIVLVIKNEDDWIQLERDHIKDAILIPWFYVGSIAAISGNTNIFVYGDDEPCYTRDCLTLKKRTKSTIVHKLEEAGLDVGKAYDLVEDTHGLFVPLKVKIYNGAVYKKPSWIENKNKAFMAALLCGKWTECDGDKLVLEELSGMSYDEIMINLSPWMKGGDPFVIEVNGYGGKTLQLANVESAWENLDNDITDKIWEDFIKLFYEVLIESEPIFEYPFDKHFEASIYAKKPDWSPTIKHGMIRSLIMRAYYRKDEYCQYQINNVVKKVLKTITTAKRWGYIAQYFTDLCEASPDIVLQRLEGELSNSTGMKELFGINDGNSITGRHYYTNILWAVEQLLLQKEYVVRAVKWLWKVDAINIKYSISNSPKSILETVFCAWINVSVLSVDEKIDNAKWAVENYDNAWEIIYSELPERRTSICSTINHPHYRSIDDIAELYNTDVRKTYIEYINICLSKMDTSAEKWKKIIESMENYYDELIDKITEKLLKDVALMKDGEKIMIKDTFRYEIYRHRYFCSSDWSMPESRIEKFENSMNKIHAANPVYEYLYLFSPTYEFPLIHPIPYNREDIKNDGREENDLLKEKEIENGIKEFKERKLPLAELLSLCSKKENSTIGMYIAKYYDNRIFDEKIVKMMLDLNVTDHMIINYVWYFLQQNEPVLERTVNLVKMKENKDNLVVSLLSMEVLSDDKVPMIANETEKIKKIFWGRDLRLFVKSNKNSYKWAISECKKYGTINTFLELLFDAKEFLNPNDVYEKFMELDQVRIEKANSMTSYYLEEVLKFLQNEFKDCNEKCAQIARIEWLFRNVLNWDDMKCTQIIMKESPILYAQLVEYIYLKEGEDKGSRTDEMREATSVLYDIYTKALFCPAEKDGRVDFDKLKVWVNEFKDLLSKQRQMNLFGHLVGRLFAYSPIGDDNCMPCEPVRQIIEEIFDESLKSSYVTAEKNKRGVYTPDAGKTELEMSRHYKDNANKIRGRYPSTASIYDLLSDIYKTEAISERRRAEDDW